MYEAVRLCIDLLGFSHISFATSARYLDVVTILMTPFGTPARSANSARASAENGVSVAGLITVVHPAARAAPSLRVIIAEGKFHGVRMELAFGENQIDESRSLHTQRLDDAISYTFEQRYSTYQ